MLASSYLPMYSGDILAETLSSRYVTPIEYKQVPPKPLKAWPSSRTYK